MKLFRYFAALACCMCNSAWAEGFVVDLTPDQADQIEGTVRADDLAVNDIAYIYPHQLCDVDGILYVPSDVELSDQEGTYGFILKVTMQPEKKLRAELVAPTAPNEFNMEDVTSVIGTLADPTSLFSSRSPFCENRQAVTKRKLDFYQILSIDGHTSLHSLANDLRSRTYDFTKE